MENINPSFARAGDMDFKKIAGRIEVQIHRKIRSHGSRTFSVICSGVVGVVVVVSRRREVGVSNVR